MPLLKKILSILLFWTISLSSFAQTNIQNILDSLEVMLEKKRIPGALISIVKADSVIYTGGIGFANVEKQERVTENHIFRLGSISKSMTALGIVKLVDDRELDLKTPISEIDQDLPIRNKWQDKSPIRVEHLLEHTAGFDDLHLHTIYSDKAQPPTCREMVDIHQNSLYARWEPGTRKAYSNPGYILAGHVIEKVSGKGFRGYLEEEIFSRLGMTKSNFYFKEPNDPLMAQGYTHQGGKFIPIEFTSINGGPSGEFCSTAKEMASYLQFMLRKKLSDKSFLIHPTYFDRIENAETTIAAKNGFPNDYGLGNYSSWKNGIHFHGHNGGIDGFSSEFIYSREADIGIAISINKNARVRDFLDYILAQLIGKKTGPPADRVLKPIPASLAEKYQGYYEFNSPRNQLVDPLQSPIDGSRFDFKNDTVFVKSIYGRMRDTLYHAGNNQFYSGDEGIPFAMFVDNEAGEPILWLNGDYAEKGSVVSGTIKIFSFLFGMIAPFAFFLFGLIYISARAFSKNKKTLKDFWPLWLASVSFILFFMFLLLSVESIESLNKVSFMPLMVMICSILFFVLSIIGLVSSFKLSDKGRLYKAYYRFSAFSLSSLAIYFLINNLIGLRLWAY